jgi:hypothetical protein
MRAITIRCKPYQHSKQNLVTKDVFRNVLIMKIAWLFLDILVR